jgi:hypothetical protein
MTQNSLEWARRGRPLASWYWYFPERSVVGENSLCRWRFPGMLKLDAIFAEIPRNPLEFEDIDASFRLISELPFVEV